MTETRSFADRLTEQQIARIAALEAARTVLVTRGLTSSGQPDPIDLHHIAEYILTGIDPWPTLRKAPRRRWFRRRPQMLEARDTWTGT